MAKKMERFTDGARIILIRSQDAAEEFKHGIIVPEHLLLAMTRTPEIEVYQILNDFGVIESKLLPYLRDMFEKMDLPPLTDAPQLSDLTKKVLELSVDEARRLWCHEITSLHLLLGIIRLNSPTIQQIFTHFRVDKVDIREHIKAMFPDEQAGCLEGISQIIRDITGKKKNDE